MADYNFDSLTHFDFEDLVRDLLQEELSIRLESFAAGPDNGIDFRYFAQTDSQLIIQCKHYSKSSFSKLEHDLKKELIKIRRKNPDRYILATSQGLTPNNKDKIKILFEPYIISTADIFGFDDLNNLLRIHEVVAKKNYKLWFTSVHVLERIVHSAIYNQSNLEIEKFKEIVKLFVKNKAYHQVRQHLKKDNYCIIVGNPGIGKTSIALYIASQYLEKNFELISCNTIDDAYRVYNPKKKQFFYYDDFLGQTIFGDKLGKNEDQRLLDFLSSVKKSKNTKFLLTTRNYILNRAQLSYEKLNSLDFNEGKHFIELSDYSLFQKAKILYNHLWYSNLSRQCIQEIISEHRYVEIISHRNFTPRIIKVMTTLPINSDENCYNYFINSLENPTQIWEHAFKFQIFDSSRNLLYVLSTVPKNIDLDSFQEVFLAFHIFRAKKYNLSVKDNDFEVALKELDGSFIIISPNKNKKLTIDFENPSIHDFINNLLFNKKDIAFDLCESFIFFQQSVLLWNILESHRLSKEYLPENFVHSLIRTYSSDLRSYDQWHYYHNEWIYGLFEYSFEERLLFIVSLSNKIQDRVLIEFISEQLKLLICKINENKIYPRDLLRLIENIFTIDDETYPFEVTKKDLFTAIKDAFFRDLTNLEDFENILELFEITNQKLSQDEYEMMKTRFEKDFKSIVISEIDKISGIHTRRYQISNQIGDQLNMENIIIVELFVKKLKRYSDFFNVNLREEIDLLQEKIDKTVKKDEYIEDFLAEEYSDMLREEKSAAEFYKTQIEIHNLFLYFNE